MTKSSPGPGPGFRVPPPTIRTLPQELYDDFAKVTEEVEGKGVLPYCRVCMKLFEVGKKVGWAWSNTAGNYIGVHFECHLKPLTKDITPEELLKTKKAWNRIHQKPCTCPMDVIIQSGCQCGGV